MAEITTTQSFSDGDTVTATKLNNIQANASVQPDAITNRTAETTIDQANDLLLIYDASATALKKVSASNLIKAGTASDFPITGNATIGGTLGVTGTSALTGNTTIGGTLGVTGAITATSTINGTTIPTTKTLVTTVDTQTLTNKTLTSPSISDPTITGQITASTSIINIGSGQIYKDATGNVGVGTASPRGKLDVSGGLFLAGGNQIQITGNSGTTGLQMIGNDSAESVIGTMSSQALVLRTAAAERLRIDSSGNVGVGTASPTHKLTLENADTNPYISFNTAGVLKWLVGKEGTQSERFVIASTSAYRMVINSNGDVGIGTATPSSKLHVVANQNSCAYTSSGATQHQLSTVFNGNNANLYYGVEGSSTGRTDVTGTLDNASYFGSRSTHATQLISNNSARMTIDSSGRVMIGTTSPASNNPLTVFDSINGGISLANSINHARIAQNGDDVYFDMGAGGTAGSLIFRRSSANTESLRIASAGQIGIGGANYGTSGQVLTSAGASTAPSWTTISTTPADGSITPAKLSQPFTAATAVNSTSGSVIDFTSIPSWVKRITVMLSGVSTSGSSLPIIRLGTSAGVQVTGYIGRTYDSTTGTASYSSGFTLASDHTASNMLYGAATITLLSSNTFTVTGLLSRSDTTNQYKNAGGVTLSSTLDRIRVTTVNGTDTFDAGIINIMYEG